MSSRLTVPPSPPPQLPINILHLSHSSTPVPSPMGPPAARTRRGRAKHTALFHKNRFSPYDCPSSQSAATGPDSSVPDSPIHLPSSLPLLSTSSSLHTPPC